MSTEEARQIVKAGLENRKAVQLKAEQEARLEQYEQDQIRFCNKNCADARIMRKAEDANQLTIQQALARRNARAVALAKAQEQEDKAMRAVRYYSLACLVVLWLTAVTRLPLWAAVALALGLGVFPAAYIFRLYFPMEG